MVKDVEKDVGGSDPLEETHRADGSKTAVGITTLIVVTAIILIVGGVIAVMM